MKPEVSYAVPAVFPREYTKFNPGEIRVNVARLQGRSNLKVYDLAWLGLMEEIDRVSQRRAITNTRQKLRGVPFADNRSTHQEVVQDYWATLESTSCYPQYLTIKGDFDRRDPDLTNLDNIEVLPWVLDAITSAGGNSEHVQYAIMLQKRLGARIRAATPILGLYQKVTSNDGFSRSNLADKLKEPDFFEREVRRTLAKTEPYHKLDPILNSTISQMEDKLFGEEIDQAAILWRDAIFLRTTQLPESVSGNDIRVPLLTLLVQKKYRQAALYLEEVLAKYPRLLPSFAIDKLNIDPAGLRNIMDAVSREEKSKTETLRQEDITLRRLVNTERWNQARAATQERHAQNDLAENIIRRARNETIEGYMGQELVSPDGNVRICVIRKSSRRDGKLEGITYAYTYEGISVSGLEAAQGILGLIEQFQLTPREELERLQVSTTTMQGLRPLRQEKGLSQGEIARLADLRQTDISKAETGEYDELRIRWFGIIRIAQAIGVSPFDIATEEGKERLTELMEKYPQMIS